MSFRYDRLRQLRKKKKLRQDDVAEYCGVVRTSVCNWEAGARVPDIDKLVFLGDLLETSVDYLLGRTDDPTRPNAEAPNAKEIFEHGLHWDGVPLKPEELKPIRDLLQIVVRNRLPKFEEEEKKIKAHAL